MALFTTTSLSSRFGASHVIRHYPEDKRLPADVALARDDFTGMVKVAEEHMRGRNSSWAIP